ncbi:hypothetical protein J1N35_022629 [Gossypium stocksii]|uniref:Uncharacterized protein n=1 Tax=Gossypium stocksii TaxID=47602 RepID=A0A9D4A2F8_9ROSI|nr:hypothetical protein J1N35_022629 [Gossypium stocksii]
MNLQEEGINEEGKTNKKNNNPVEILKPGKKSSWKRIEVAREITTQHGDFRIRKRKLEEIAFEKNNTKIFHEDAVKRMKHDDEALQLEAGTTLSAENLKQDFITHQNRSAAAKRSADQAQ